MSIKVRLKHSSTLNKEPLPADLDSGELALNINENSPAAYIKDSAGNIVKLAGPGDGTGVSGYWDRTGTELSPATNGDSLQLKDGTGAVSVDLDAGASAGPLVRDSSGRLLVGTTTSSKAYKLVVRNDAGNGGFEGGIFLQRATTPPTGSHGLGTVAFGAAPTGDENESAKIVAKSDGDWGVNDWPSRLEFHTTSDGSNTPTERMTIKSDGKVGIGTATPAGTLSVNNASSNSVIEVTRGAEGAGYGYTIVGADGATTPALRFQTVSNGVWGSEVARFDSAGRLLVGATSTTDSTTAVLQGRPGDPNGAGAIYLQGGYTGGSGDFSHYGEISFKASTGKIAEISGYGAPRTGGTPGELRFATTADGSVTPVERARIDSAGNFLFGGTLPSAPNISLNPVGKIYSGRANGEAMDLNRDSSVGATLRILYEDAEKGWLGTNSVNGLMLQSTGTLQCQSGGVGGVQLTGSATSWSPLTSESRLKDFQSDPDVDQCWNLVRDIQLKRYYYKDQEDKTGVSYMGPMADWLGVQDPELLIDTGRSDDDGPIHTYNQGLLDMKALAALSAALKRIEQLEAKVTALEGGAPARSSGTTKTRR